MSDKAEAQKWYYRWQESAGGKSPHDAFLAGYAAASADCEAQVRAAVEATIEEAAKVSAPYRELGKSYTAAAPTSDERIRALDASAIVARVMHKEEQ